MKKYLHLIILFSIFISGCAKHNRIDFSSSKTFFSSLNEKKEIREKNKKHSSSINNFIEKKIKNKDELIITNSLLLNTSNYKNILKQKIGLDEYAILKIFNNPSLRIKHGKIKNFQFHLKSCHLDLFFLNENETYVFKHFDIRPSAILSNLNKKRCLEELNKKFTLILDPK